MKLLIILMILTIGLEYSSAQDIVIPFRKYNQWYFVDVNGDRIGNNTYQDAFSFSNELAVVKKEGKYGFINRKDSLVIPCKYDFAKCENGALLVSVNADTFYIDLKGNEIKLPGNYYNDSPFNKSTLNRVFSDNGKYGVTFLGDTIVSASYDSIAAMDFTDAILIWDEWDKIGIFNRKGEQIIPFELDSFNVDHISYPNLIWIYRSGKIGALNLLGEIMAYPRYHNLTYENEFVYTVLKNGKKGYIYEGEEYWRDFLWW